MDRDYSPAEKRRGLKKSLGIMFLVALAGDLVVKLHRGDQLNHYIRGAQGRWVGELLGESIAAFLAGLVFFFTFRLLRRADVPTAGLVTGIIVILLWCAALYKEASLELSGVLPS